MLKKKCILCVLLAIIFTVATSCTNQSNQDNVVKTKEEWITEFAKDICETDFPCKDMYLSSSTEDFHYIYELLIQEDETHGNNEIPAKFNYNYVFSQIALIDHAKFCVFSVYLLVDENPHKDKHYNPKKLKKTQLQIKKEYATMSYYPYTQISRNSYYPYET